MGLRSYVLQRIALIIPLFFITSAVIFTLIHLAPGDPIAIMFASAGARPSAQVIQQIKLSLGLDEPVYVQYLLWIGKLLRGDLGYSYISQRPIAVMIAERFWNTIVLMSVALVISLLTAILLGVAASVRKYSALDNTFSLFALFGYSMPNFWIALILIAVFGVRLGWFPIFGAHTRGVSFSTFGYWVDYLHHMVLPALVVSTLNTAYLFRLVRSSMLDVLREDYVTTARAKGLKERVVIYKHAFRNTLLPLVTFVGLSIGFILSGAVVVEYVFSWPGLGKLAVDVALQRDYPALMGVSMVIAAMVLFANLITDVVYAFIDPRIRY